METTKGPVRKDLVLVGGGHSHVAVLKRFGMRPMDGVRLTLIARRPHPYSGMLPGYLAGHYTYDEAHIDLRPLARFAGARLYHDEMTGLDAANRQVLCRGRPPVPYDLLSIDIGSQPSRVGIPGAERVLPVKPVDRFLAGWAGIAERALAAGPGFRIAVVGGGAGVSSSRSRSSTACERPGAARASCSSPIRRRYCRPTTRPCGGDSSGS